jgi:hypothetical protein
MLAEARAESAEISAFLERLKISDYPLGVGSFATSRRETVNSSNWK